VHSLGLRILHGEHADALIDACLEEICREAIHWPQKRAFLIVPEQTKADMERRYLKVRKSLDAGSGLPFPSAANALMLVDVVSFSRFAHRILSEVGGFPDEYLDEATETMLIHRILHEGKADFKVLSALSDRIGFVPEVQSVLGDFVRYHVTPEKIRELDNPSLDPAFLAKMSDFALLIRRLSSREKELGYCGRNDELQMLSETMDKMTDRGTELLSWPLNRLDYLHDTSIWILGFGQMRDFTPQESEIITRLHRLCEKVTISVCTDSVPRKRSQIQDGSAAFFFGRQTIWNLMDRFPGSTLRNIPETAGKNPALPYLAHAFAVRGTVPFDGDASKVRVLFLKNSMDELHYAAGEIRRLVLTEGYRYNEISVVLCSQSAYESNLHAVFAEYGLDPFLDKRRPLSGTVLVRFVLAMLDLGVSGWSFRPLMTCLKSGMCHITQEDSDRLENYCLEHGLFRGYRIFSESSYDENSDPDGKMQGLVRRVLLPVRDFLVRIEAAGTCAGKASELLSFMQTYGGAGEDGYLPGIAGQVEALSREWSDAKDQDAALALVVSFNELTALLQKLKGPIGDTEMSLLNFRSMLSAGMEAAFSGAIPSYVDQIQISDTRRGAQRTCRALFLIGAAGGIFPFKTVKEGYLRGYERELLAENLGIPFPSRARDQVFADHFTAYSILDCPQDRIYLSCPLTDEPSSLFGLVHDIFPNLADIKNPPVTEHDPRLFSKTALQRYIRAGLSDSASQAERINLGRIVRRFPDLAPPDTARKDFFDVRIPSIQIDRRFGSIEKMSVSQIEAYAECPFRHFGQYVIGLEERKIYQTATNVVGSLLHSILETSMTEYRTESVTAESPEEKKWIHEKYLNRDYRQWAGRLLKTAAEQSADLVVRDPAFLAGDGSRIIRVAEHSLRALFRDISPDSFEPEKMEWKFGEPGMEPVQINLPFGRSVRFRGTIDRVDLNPDRKEYRIVDYKSGDKKVNYASLYYGLSVQLPAYLHAYSAENPGMTAAVAGYFHLTSPMIPITDLSGKPDADELSRKIGKTYTMRRLDLDKDCLRLAGDYAMKKIGDHCRALFSGDFSVSPRLLPGKGSKPACIYCPYTPVCGIDPARPPCVRLQELPAMETGDGKKAKKRDVFSAKIKEELSRKEGDNT